MADSSTKSPVDEVDIETTDLREFSARLYKHENRDIIAIRGDIENLSRQTAHELVTSAMEAFKSHTPTVLFHGSDGRTFETPLVRPPGIAFTLGQERERSDKFLKEWCDLTGRDLESMRTPRELGDKQGIEQQLSSVPRTPVSHRVAELGHGHQLDDNKVRHGTVSSSNPHTGADNPLANSSLPVKSSELVVPQGKIVTSKPPGGGDPGNGGTPPQTPAAAAQPEPPKPNKPKP